MSIAVSQPAQQIAGPSPVVEVDNSRSSASDEDADEPAPQNAGQADEAGNSDSSDSSGSLGTGKGPSGKRPTKAKIEAEADIKAFRAKHAAFVEWHTKVVRQLYRWFHISINLDGTIESTQQALVKICADATLVDSQPMKLAMKLARDIRGLWILNRERNKANDYDAMTDKAKQAWDEKPAIIRALREKCIEALEKFSEWAPPAASNHNSDVVCLFVKRSIERARATCKNATYIAVLKFLRGATKNQQHAVDIAYFLCAAKNGLAQAVYQALFGTTLRDVAFAGKKRHPVLMEMAKRLMELPRQFQWDTEIVTLVDNHVNWEFRGQKGKGYTRWDKKKASLAPLRPDMLDHEEIGDMKIPIFSEDFIAIATRHREELARKAQQEAQQLEDSRSTHADTSVTQ